MEPRTTRPGVDCIAFRGPATLFVVWHTIDSMAVTPTANAIGSIADGFVRTATAPLNDVVTQCLLQGPFAYHWIPDTSTLQPYSAQSTGRAGYTYDRTIWSGAARRVTLLPRQAGAPAPFPEAACCRMRRAHLARGTASPPHSLATE
jgi:hypothetical protein